MRLRPFAFNRLTALKFCFCLLLSLIIQGEADADTASASYGKEYEDALKTAREGSPDAAIPFFRKILTERPRDQRILGDYVTILGWAGRDEEALEVFLRIDAKKAPVYVINAAAKSARNIGRLDKAVELYADSIESFPNNRQGYAGLVLSLSDAGRAEQAVKTADGALDMFPDDPDILFSKAYAFEAMGDTLQAFWTYELMFSVTPRNDRAKRGLILTLSSLDAPGLAISMAEAEPGLISDNDWRRLRGDWAAAKVRWGELTQPSEEKRFDETDEAVVSLEKNLAALSGEGLARQSPHVLRGRFDRIIALRDRFRMKEAAEEYERLLKEGVEPPFYIRVAAADAYLYLQKSEKAAKLYEAALAENPDSYNIRLSLFYALIEMGDFDKALEAIDSLAQSEPEWRKRGKPAVYGENMRKLRADIASAQGRAFGDYLDKAQEKLEKLLRRAPFNHDLRQTLGWVYLWRGWPRKAEEQFDLIHAVEKEYMEARLGKAYVDLDLARWRSAEERIAGMYGVYPEHKRVQQLKRSWELGNMRQFTLHAGYGGGTGAEPASENFRIDAHLYSAPVAYNFKFFLHGYYEEASVDNVRPFYQREGVGVIYADEGERLSLELVRDKGSASDVGLAGGYEWSDDDYLSISADFDTHSLAVPLRARLHGISAWSAGAAARYRFSEMTYAKLGYQRLEFSDGNIRQSGLATFENRMVNGPYLKIPLTLEGYASRNSKRSRPYYNPEEDFSLSATVDFRWLVWREYDWSFTHNLALTFGRYWQKGYDAKETGGLRYEHDWNLSDKTKLLYGVTWNRRTYDGSPEDSAHVYMFLSWRF